MDPQLYAANPPSPKLQFTTSNSYKPDITVNQILAHFTPDYKSLDAPNTLLLANILHHPIQLRSIKVIISLRKSPCNKQHYGHPALCSLNYALSPHREYRNQTSRWSIERKSSHQESFPFPEGRREFNHIISAGQDKPHHTGQPK